MKLNKGEWGEPYAALRILSDGLLRMADEKGDEKPGEWMKVLELIRREAEGLAVLYRRDSAAAMIEIDLDGSPIATLPVSGFSHAADALLKDIKEGRGASFEVSDEVNEFLLLARMMSLKAKSSDKNDLFLTTLDPRSGVCRERIGFSVKSKFGKDPTLFNTAPASAVRYRLDGATRSDMEEINAILDEKGHVAVRQRCFSILNRGITPVYVGYAVGFRAQCESFKENLDVIDSRLPKVIESILWNHFFEGETCVDVSAVIDRVVRENPCGISRPEVKYPYMMKSFLYAAYCGMTASTLWSGEAKVNGGFITVDQNGKVLAHYALDSGEFKSYLYENCYLEFPSTGKGHGDYAKVYEEDGTFYFHLNFQIRYR